MTGRALVAVVAGVCLVAVAALAATLGPVSLAGTPDDMPAEYRCTVACSGTRADTALRAGAVDAWPTLQTALNAALPGTAVALPPGRFEVSRPLEVPTAVIFAGSGRALTTLVVAPNSKANFRNTFMVGAAEGTVGDTRSTIIRDMALEGGHDGSDDAGAGGFRAGTGWVITRVRLADLGYFKVWLNGVSRVTISNSVFADRNGGSSGHDNIGGGNTTEVTIADNIFTETARGNAIDLLRSDGLLIDRNRIRATPERPHNVYLEGVVRARVTNNQLQHSAISVQSNADYDDHDTVINPRQVEVSGNTVTDAAAQGISVRYDAPRAGQPVTADSAAVGGGNRVVGNTVTRPGVAGIAVIAAAPGLAGVADTVADNTVIDAFAGGERTWNCGYGITVAVGILIGAGEGVDVYRNIIRNTGTGTSTAEVGVAVGVRSSRGVPVSVVGVDTTMVDGLAESVVYQS